MRINHTTTEIYKVYSYLPCKGELFKDVKRWYPYKHYSTKQGALSAIKRLKEKFKDSNFNDFVYKIVWSPYPFASDEECVTIYTEEV